MDEQAREQIYLRNKIEKIYKTLNKQKPKQDEQIYLRILTKEDREQMEKFWDLAEIHNRKFSESLADEIDKEIIESLKNIDSGDTESESSSLS